MTLLLRAVAVIACAFAPAALASDPEQTLCNAFCVIKEKNMYGRRVLGIEARTGTVRVGLEADLVAYDGDPLADSRVFFEPRLVVSDGAIVVEGAEFP